MSPWSSSTSSGLRRWPEKTTAPRPASPDFCAACTFTRETPRISPNRQNPRMVHLLLTSVLGSSGEQFRQGPVGRHSAMAYKHPTHGVERVENRFQVVQQLLTERRVARLVTFFRGLV